MATGAKNAKSQMTTVRIPHEVMDDIEQLKEPGESTAGFSYCRKRRDQTLPAAQGQRAGVTITSAVVR